MAPESLAVWLELLVRLGCRHGFPESHAYTSVSRYSEVAVRCKAPSVQNPTTCLPNNVLDLAEGQVVLRRVD